MQTKRFHLKDLADSKQLNVALKCGICKDLVYEPMECPKCKTFFCEMCIKVWKIANDKCPNNCNGYFSVQHLSGYWKHALLKLDIVCAECAEIFELGYADFHSRQCLEAVIKCRQLTCQVSCKRKDMQQHDEQCTHRLRYSQLFSQVLDDSVKQLQIERLKRQEFEDKQEVLTRTTRARCSQNHALAVQRVEAHQRCSFCTVKDKPFMVGCIPCELYLCDPCHSKLSLF